MHVLLGGVFRTHLALALTELHRSRVTYNSIIGVFERADHQWTNAAALLEERQQKWSLTAASDPARV